MLGLDELHNRSAEWMTFFVLVVAQERSEQFRASVIRRKNFERRNGALRGDKIFEVKVVDNAQHAHFCLFSEALSCVASSPLQASISQDFALSASR